MLGSTQDSSDYGISCQTQLDLIHTQLDLIHSQIDFIHNQLDLIHSQLDLFHTQLHLIHISPTHSISVSSMFLADIVTPYTPNGVRFDLCDFYLFILLSDASTEYPRSFISLVIRIA